MKQSILLLLLLLTCTVFVASGENNVKQDGKPPIVANKRTFDSIRLEKFNIWSKTYRKGPVLAKEWDYYSEVKDTLKLDQEQISELPRERGLFAIDDIKEGDTLINIDWVSILSMDLINVELNQLHGHIKHLNLTEDDVLAIGIMIYKFCMETESFGLKHWIKTLPTQYNTVLYFEDQVLERLKGSPAYVHAMMEITETQELYKKLESTFFKSRYLINKCSPKSDEAKKEVNAPSTQSVISWDQFRWAVSTVQSRKIYSMNPDDEELTVIIPPIIDYANYNFDPSTSFELTNSGGNLKLLANRDIKKGEQITMAYASQDCNSDLLLDYGFLDFNSNALACVNILYEELLETIKEDDPKKVEKINILNRFMNNDQTPRLKLFRESMTEDLLKISKYLSYKTSSLIPYLRSLIEMKLSHYPTSFVQDQRFQLTNEFKNLPYREKLAFQLAYMEKSILHDTDKHLEKQMQNQEPQEPQETKVDNSQSTPPTPKVKDEL